MRLRCSWFHLLVLILTFISVSGAELRITDDKPLLLPSPGAYQLRILLPTTLELTLVTTKPPDPARVAQWDFVNNDQRLRLPGPGEFVVLVDGKPIAVREVGFKRRVLYAPLRQRDLRIGNYLYLQLMAPVTDGQLVEVQNPGARLWSTNVQFIAKADPSRFSPALHVNQVGYAPQFPKRAMVGYFLGSLGELDIPKEAGFALVDVRTGTTAYQGKLSPRGDVGYEYSPRPYQEVVEADFSRFETAGEYRLIVPGLGASFPFFIHEGALAAWARAYALGLYHQRCGADNALPFTRFVHGPCHTLPADIPTAQFTNMARFLAEITADYTNNPRHVAPPLKDFDSGLYPFVGRAKINSFGGHHDAGDYSKYTINSASLVHYLVFAADAFAGAGELDNLGLPESGDGRSDLLQEAKWEADFLAKLQDDDGGFYFLVYPRDRKYENNVLPDGGDPQIVWPKNTAATAAAVAALAQTASSPLFKKQFPDAARLYLDKARKGWGFLERAIARYGRDGAYQKITHYGDDFMHDDELAWAACELFLATGDESFHKKLREWLDPSDVATRRWGWWRLCESYGSAIRSYALAAKTGRLKRQQLDRNLLKQCEDEVMAGADDQHRWAQQCAYGTSFPTETKRFRGGGWYFSLDRAFDLAAASALEHPAAHGRRAKYLEAMLSNLNYEAGCNPVNVCYVTGLGWKRQRDIVHQYAQNDRRVLPLSGLPLGNVQAGFMWLDFYQRELGALSFPLDGAENAPYPIYDRWGDSFNVQTEFVIVNQARGLATLAFLMAQTSIKDQPWRPSRVQIEVHATKGSTNSEYVARLNVSGLNSDEARIVWEAEGHEPMFGLGFPVKISASGPRWIEAEARWPDGRRVFAATNFPARMPQPKRASN